MSLSKPCAAPPDRRVVPAVAASSTGALHPDAVYEILLRLPAKELCRLRAVCRWWRSLLSDPQFIAAHSARHPGPLIVAGHHPMYGDDGVLFDIMDLSGHVVKRVRSTGPTRGRGKERVTSIQSHLVCITDKSCMSCRLLDPATGSVCAFPKGFSEEVDPWCNGNYRNASVAFGKVGPTGDYKALRVLDSCCTLGPLYEVCTLDGSSQARWRHKQAPTYHFRLSFLRSVVVNGKVYFFTALLDVHVAYFDLETEEWSPSIMGPLISIANNADGLPINQINWNDLSLAELSGCLVVVDRSVSSSLDLWFLMDFEKGIWVKQYSMQVNLSARLSEVYLYPLLVLNDGRIVTYLGRRGSLMIYDPSTSNYTEVEMKSCITVGLYTGSLLSQAGSAN